MSSDFDKSEQKKTEVAIINRISVKLIKRTGKREVTEESWKQFQDEIEKEIENRPNMRLTNIQALDKAMDQMGNPVNHTLAYLLIFEERDDSLVALRMDINQIHETIERICRSGGY